MARVPASDGTGHASPSLCATFGVASSGDHARFEQHDQREGKIRDGKIWAGKIWSWIRVSEVECSAVGAASAGPGVELSFRGLREVQVKGRASE